MRFRLKTIVALLTAPVMLSAANHGFGQQPQEQQQPTAAPAKPVSYEDAIGNAALAERIAQFAQLSLAGKTIVPATLRQSAALLEAANHLNPREPRFLRLLTEAYLQLGGDEGRDGAISSLTRYLQLPPAVPGQSDPRADQVAQIQLIDLYYSRLDAADAQMKYLNERIENASLSSEVRAHLAVKAAKLALDRSETALSHEYLEKALGFFPLSPDALAMKYQQLPGDATSPQRVAMLLQMLRSNPVQPGAMGEIASLLADAGLVDLSLSWSERSMGVGQRLGWTPNPQQYTAYAAELVIADQLKVAEGWIDKLIEHEPGNGDAAFLAMLVAKRGGQAETIEAAAAKVRTALALRLRAISEAAAKPPAADASGAQPTTQPSISEIDIPADLKKLAEAQNLDLSAAYASGLADLAWLEMYFNSNPAAAAPYVAALRQILPSESPTLVRLEGWAFLVDGKNDEAKVKLSAIADRDPLAALGMFRIDAATADPMEQTNAARKLLAGNSSGLVGAMLIEAVRGQVGLMPAGPDADELRDLLGQLSPEWLDFLDDGAKKLYSIQALPLKVGHAFGEPILANIKITNIHRQFSITVGPNGALRPDIWIDAQTKGMIQRYFAGVAFERLGHKVQLKPNESITQTVRLDQGNLLAMLDTQPVMEIPLYFSALTNPLTQSAGIAPGPGGFRVQFTSVVARNRSPLADGTIRELTQQLLSGPPNVRIRTLDLLATFARTLRAQDAPEFRGKATEITDLVRKSTGDVSPAVRAQATFMTALLAEPSIREGVVRQMLSDTNFAQRVLGLMALQVSADPAKRKELAEGLSRSDPDPIVKLLAVTVMEVADLPPPATQPSQEGGQPQDPSMTSPISSGSGQ
jgi:hypothetical protein